MKIWGVVIVRGTTLALAGSATYPSPSVEERDMRQSLTGKLSAISAAPELTTAIMGPDAKAPAFSKGARQPIRKCCT